jgi:hypothetical protein
MVDLGQKGWEQFHLFYWYKVKGANPKGGKEAAIKTNFLDNKKTG